MPSIRKTDFRLQFGGGVIDVIHPESITRAVVQLSPYTWLREPKRAIGEALIARWSDDEVLPQDHAVGELLSFSGTQPQVPQHRRDDLQSTFDALAEVWRDETLASSSTSDICTHWAYQRIIGLGPDVVPLIIEAVRGGERHWTWALAALTGENPALETQSQAEAAEAWLRWAENAGLLKHESERVG